MKKSRHTSGSSSDESDNGRRKLGESKGKKAGRWTEIKEKQKVYDLRDRSQSRDTLPFKDIVPGSSTCWSQHSSQARRPAGQKPSEVFRTDLITAMKVHDSFPLSPEEFYVLADPWRQEWEKGVQVPVSPQAIPQPVTRVLADKGKELMFVKPKKLIRTSGAEALGYVDIRTLAEGMCRYDLNEQDAAWLQAANGEFAEMAVPPLDEISMERAMEEFERRCLENMTHATETEEGLGIEYDEDVVCDVCRSPDGEDNNEMVFCDKCNICVHQACYGIQKVPSGSWLCRICALGIVPKCQLCPKRGGAMKPTRSGTKWVHVSCALWIPEVSIGNPEKMEPITNVSHIPPNRWALLCCLCSEKAGACIQCSAKSCRTAFHVTCGLHAGLEMSTLLTQDDEVQFKSYCPEHSGLQGAERRDRDSGGEEEEDEEEEQKDRRKGGEEEEAASPGPAPQATAPRPSAPAPPGSRQQEKRLSLRQLKLQQMEEEFYRFVEAGEVAGRLKLPPPAVDFLFQYWKLKRRANFNQPLLTPRKDEEDSLARREHEVLLRRLKLFTHLRQDLERVRNLTYMVTRREKMKRSLCRVQEQILHHRLLLLDRTLADPQDEEALSSSRAPARSSSTGSGSRAKLPPKREKRKSGEGKDGPSKPPEAKDGRGPRVKEPGEAQKHEAQKHEAQKHEAQKHEAQKHEAQNHQTQIHQTQNHQTQNHQTQNHQTQNHQTQNHEAQKPHKPDGVQEAAAAKPHRGDCRRGLRREAPGPEHEAPARRKREGEQEERRRRRKRRSGEAQVKNQAGSRHLERTVSIRLVDIRNDDYFTDARMTKRSPAPLQAASGAKPDRASKGSDAPNANGYLRKAAAAGSHATNRHGGGHLRSWGKFRIPKRREKPLTEEEEEEEEKEEEEEQQPDTPEPSCPKTRHRAGAEPGGEAEPHLKRCHSHQLRGAAALGRRYGGDIMRHGVLAS